MPKVLLVEDDNNLREIFEMRLQAEGYETMTASDGEEALVVALREKPDLMISDVMMPKMSGFEMLETLRAAPDTNNIKVIMMTALGQAEDQARGQKLGVVKYLVKSQVTLEDFVSVVKEVLAPGSGAATAAPATPEPVQGDQPTNKGSEGNMPPTDNNAPTNDTPAPAADANPVSDAPADAGAQSTADAQAGVQNQIDNAMGSAPAADAGAGADIPVATPPADPAPAPEAPAEPAPAPEAPAEGGTPPAAV